MSAPPLDVLISGIAFTANVFRFSFDLVVLASKKGDSDKPNDNKNKKKSDSSGSKTQTNLTSTQYGTDNNNNGKEKTGKGGDEKSIITNVTETTSLIGGNTTASATTDGDLEDPINNNNDDNPQEEEEKDQKFEENLYTISLYIHAILFAYFFYISSIVENNQACYTFGLNSATFLLGFIVKKRDPNRERFGPTQRFLYVVSALLQVWSTYLLMKTATPPALLPLLGYYGVIIFLYSSIIGFALFVIVDAKFAKQRHSSIPKIHETDKKKATLSIKSTLVMLKPYFWPTETKSSSAAFNRLRVILTWVCVLLSKASNLIGPVFLGKATTQLSRSDFKGAIINSILYALSSFANKFFGEGQRLLYLKVAQAAFIQLAEVSFTHLHSLSLDWHLRKKMGEVIRSLDRGIMACDTLMKYLFLWLIPAIGECVTVCFIFGLYFNYFPLSVTVFYFVFIYMIVTIVLTLWRKKFRKAVAKSDNDWHDRCTDSLINFETVKYFTAEEFEAKRFRESVDTYQTGTVNVQGSLSLLNISQQIIYQTCLATCLSLAAMGVKARYDCCGTLDNAECGYDTCPGMEIGDFVAVLSYTASLFAPLNFLGSVYNAIVMAFIDLTNLSELLAQNPDIQDMPGAIDLPKHNSQDPDVAVEFDNVVFNYPTQPENTGLKGLSFKMKKGTTTAIVGSTGAGKTTISRLLFRFYDVVYGSVKVNGVDVRNVTQKSLRGSIGVVPQAATLFNDTIKYNIRYGKRDATQAELDQVAQDAQMMDFIGSLKDGWDTIVGDRGLKLSGGEKQRASIARCLLKNPAFVLLDEATSALDSVTESSVQEALDRLGQDRTCLVIAHRLGTIRNADQIIVVHDGIVAEQGTHDELLELDGRYADMW
eukprot:CAMPEP_0178969328 /NCGR_PEP_ID=MMETSP0789-20121207/18787_1 /TAXON_ID=3005 /ORGANISM="Rhizosolenia setigera, Strain CCMP 1694" /LENGTH=877 /DNA_ID=CAMNT_0020655433 /DNA_START=52 /DNA_END=2682 /DNA_ORIENTATION=+